jgi:hypothetical protein
MGGGDEGLRRQSMWSSFFVAMYLSKRWKPHSGSSHKCLPAFIGGGGLEGKIRPNTKNETQKNSMGKRDPPVKRLISCHDETMVSEMSKTLD